MTQIGYPAIPGSKDDQIAQLLIEQQAYRTIPRESRFYKFDKIVAYSSGQWKLIDDEALITQVLASSDVNILDVPFSIDRNIAFQAIIQCIIRKRCKYNMFEILQENKLLKRVKITDPLYLSPDLIAHCVLIDS